ncbi:MAG: (2Fe-2S)-binding protein [bacterium]|nr:(2Fe-2S)-binding protein [bacterium]
MKLNFKLNGEHVNINVDDSKRLLDILREDFFLTGTKEGCGVGECGACTVIMNGNAIHSCIILPPQIEGSEIETVEHLEQNGELSDLQEAFIKHGAIQCGFCTPGMLMSATALLRKNPNPNEDEIKEALEGNLCRCTGYIPIIDSIKSL